MAPLAAGAVDVVAERRAAIADGVAEDASDGAMEAARFVGGEGRRLTLGMESRGKQGFVGVDVADAGDDPLVEKNGLDRGASLHQRLAQPVGGEIVAQGLGAERANGVLRPVDDP